MFSTSVLQKRKQVLYLLRKNVMRTTREQEELGWINVTLNIFQYLTKMTTEQLQLIQNAAAYSCAHGLISLHLIYHIHATLSLIYP